jgi:uncharacterized membrane protein YbhN (UPF0104 family)
VDARLLADRDTIRTVLGQHWWQAVLLTAGYLGFDYGCLLAALGATGAAPRPFLVLLAYSASGIVALFPVTLGGVGIAEASVRTADPGRGGHRGGQLSGPLILADVRPGCAVLAYRIAS